MQLTDSNGLIFWVISLFALRDIRALYLLRQQQYGFMLHDHQYLALNIRYGIVRPVCNDIDMFI